jgi:hypothetical protein
MNRLKKGDRTKQQIYLPDTPSEIIEYRSQAYKFPK